MNSSKSQYRNGRFSTNSSLTAEQVFQAVTHSVDELVTSVTVVTKEGINEVNMGHIGWREMRARQHGRCYTFR